MFVTLYILLSPGSCTIWLRLHGMGWTPGATLRVCSLRAAPSPLPRRCRTWQCCVCCSGAFGCSWRSARCLVVAVGVAFASAFGLSSAVFGVCRRWWLAVVVGVCLLALWASARPAFIFLFWWSCPFCCVSLPLGGWGWPWSCLSLLLALVLAKMKTRCRVSRVYGMRYHTISN